MPATALDSATSTVRLAFKRLSVSLPHAPRRRRASASSSASEFASASSSSSSSKRAAISSSSLTAEQHAAACSPPTSSSYFYYSPVDQQQAVIDLVCCDLEHKLMVRSVIDDPELLCFQGPKQPDISLRDYIVRLVKYANSFCDDVPRKDSSGIRTLLIAMELLERSRAVLNPRSVHRYLSTSMGLALKMMEDFVLETSYWSAVAGCTAGEYQLYERRVLGQLQFRCHVSNARFNVVNYHYGCPFDEVDEAY